jgi:predicted small secreted protein
MGKDYSDVLRYLSNKVHDLIVEIDDYAAGFPIDNYRHELTIYNLLTHFETDKYIIEKCKDLISTMNVIANLKGECSDSMQNEFCFYISTMIKKGGCAIKLISHRHIRFDDFKTVYDCDIESISKEINKQFKENVDIYTGCWIKASALIYDLDYLCKKTGDELIDIYVDCLTKHLFFCNNVKMYEEIFRTEYVHYSVWLKDYNRDKELYKRFVKS